MIIIGIIVVVALYLLWRMAEWLDENTWTDTEV